MSQKLWIEVRDSDPINPDDIIGDAFIDMDEYMEHGQQLTVPLYATYQKLQRVIYFLNLIFFFFLEKEQNLGL